MLRGLEFFFDINLKSCRSFETQWRSYDIKVIGTRLYSTVMFSAYTAIATVFLKPVSMLRNLLHSTSIKKYMWLILYIS